MKLSDFVIDFVYRQGVTHIFLLPGGGCMHLVDSVGRHPALAFVCQLHEQAAAVAADAYAQYRNGLGVALVTTGPGGTNAITGVAASYLDSTPVLILSGQVKTGDLAETRHVRQMGFQELPITKLVAPITKYAVRVDHPQDIRYEMEKAVYLAREGRPGPVWVDLPLDVQAARIDPESLRGFSPPSSQPELSESRLEEKLNEVMGLIRQAERPILLAGNGIRLAGAEKAFHEMAERLGMPIQTTWKAIDFLPDDHPLYAGRPGILAHRGANFAIQNADLVLSIGARLDYGQIGYDHSTFARAAKKVVVDIDPHEIAKLTFPGLVGIPCDAGRFLTRLHSALPADWIPPWEAWRKRCKDWLCRYPVLLPEAIQRTEWVDQYVFIDRLGRKLGAGDLVIPGSSGACCEATMQALPITKGMRVFYTPGLGAMGMGLAAAIGGCIAAGRQRAICLEGDGSLAMNSQELEVIRRLGLPIKIFIFSNGGYNSIRLTQRTHFHGHLVACDPSSGLTLPAVARLAEAYGLPYHLIKDHAGLELIDAILANPGPEMCEVLLSPDQTSQPRCSSMTRPDGKIVSKPLEDLFPFLDREELRQNMLIPPLEE